jgi:hypothetical protein
LCLACARSPAAGVHGAGDDLCELSLPILVDEMTTQRTCLHAPALALLPRPRMGLFARFAPALRCAGWLPARPGPPRFVSSFCDCLPPLPVSCLALVALPAPALSPAAVPRLLLPAASFTVLTLVLRLADVVRVGARLGARFLVMPLRLASCTPDWFHAPHRDLGTAARVARGAQAT